MPSLLCTLGTSWAVVPEAFLLGNHPDAYQRVFVVVPRGEGTVQAIQQTKEWFELRSPETELRVFAISHLTDLRDSRDHQIFEEALFRVYFGLLAFDPDIHVCLAGGFKTMSAAAHDAAGLIGCNKLFHILAEPIKTDGSARPKFPDTPEEVDAAIASQRVKLISLGRRVGWPTIQELASECPPLPSQDQPFEIDDFSLTEAVHARVDAANRLAASEADLARLPFPQLARWSPGERAALERPLDPDPNGADAAWLLTLPKVDLHCHLGGFATHGELLHQVRAAAEHPDLLPPLYEPTPPAAWPQPESSIPLTDYMRLGDANGSALLKDLGCLRKQCELLYQHLLSQNIVYAEVRCSPGNYASLTRSPWTVLCEIKAAFDSCMANSPGCQVNLLLIGTRKQQGDHRTAIMRHLALATCAAEHWSEPDGCQIVGVDLAGFEDRDTRAHYYRTDFHMVHRAGLALTVHAGENDDSEGIWSAVFDLNTRRIGHALSLIESPELLRSVADRGIAVEMCPFANFQIKGFAPMPDKDPYPLKHYLDAGVAVTVNTDNIGISAANLTDNFLYLGTLCPGITRLEILQLLRNAMDHAFLPTIGKQRLLAKTHFPKCP